jgi:hypothetical protein
MERRKDGKTERQIDRKTERLKWGSANVRKSEGKKKKRGYDLFLLSAPKMDRKSA